MSHIRDRFFAAFAVLSSLGAAQFASGHDLLRPAVVIAPDTGINRAAKSDRAAVNGAPVRTQTISFRPGDLAETTVLVRLPLVRDQARKLPVAPAEPIVSKIVVACEPPVSVLSEVAKLLPPGRCVT